MRIEPSPAALLPLTTALTAVGQQAAPAATMAQNLVDTLASALPDLDGAALYWRADDRAVCLAQAGGQAYPASLAVDRATALGQAILDNQIQTDPSTSPAVGLHVVVPLPGADHAARGALIVHAPDDQALYGERRGVLQVAAQIMALALADRAGGAGGEAEAQAADSPTIPSLLTQTSHLLAEMHTQYDTSRRIVLAGDAGEMLQALADFVGDGCLYAELNQYEDARSDAAPTRLRTLGLITPDGLQRGEAETAFADHPARAAYETLADGLPLVIPDVQQEALLDKASRAAFGARGVNSVIVLPLISERLPLGQIVLGGESPEALDTDRVRAYQSLADQIAGAIGRTQLLDTLARERNLLRTLMDALPDLIYAKDTKSRFIMGNTRVARLMGVETAEALLGKTDYDFYPEALAAQYFADEQALIQSGQPLLDREEPLLNVTTGETGWLATSKVLLRDPEGRVSGFVGIGRDITARKLAEEQLAQERNLLRTLIDNVPDYIYTKDTLSRFTLVNQAVARHLGAQTPDEVLGKTDFDFSPLELAEQYYADEQALFRSGRPLLDRVEMIVHQEEGTRRWVSTNKIPLRDPDGTIIGLVGINHDITARKLAEEQLAQERNLLRTLIDNIPDYIFVKDRQSRMVINNLAHAAGLFGSTPQEVVGKTDFDFFPPDLAQQYFEDEQGLMERGEALVDLEEPSVDHEGHPKWHLAAKLPLRDEQGNVIGLVGIVRDITARKLAEQERERLLAMLETRARQLQTAAEVSRAASSILNPEALMWQAVRLIRERFDLYYAGIFLVDEAGKYAWLRAGTGEAGQQMLKAGHKLAVGGTSMIGWCVAHQQARIALDVGQEAVRFDNPLLPETRTEMALPLISRGQAIGAMTIQSAREAAFAEEDIAVLQTMADQLANAIENARLFAEARARAAREQSLNRIAARLQEHADVHTLLNAAVEGLGQALGARTGRVRLSTPDRVADFAGQGNGDGA